MAVQLRHASQFTTILLIISEKAEEISSSKIDEKRTQMVAT